jgi:uncharacterized protein (TIGR02285 family)
VRHRILGRAVFACGLLVVLGLPARLPAADEITWLTMEFPPFFVHTGKDTGQGIADGVTHRLQAHLPGYTHREEIAEPATIMARLKAGDHVCTAAYIKTPERERVAAFSVPDLVLPPNGVTVRAADVGKLTGGASGPVSLAALLSRADLRLGVALGRSYSPALDRLLEPTKHTPHVYWRQGKDIYPGLFDMLMTGKLDYVLGYPFEAVYVARQRGVEGQVVTLPLTELPDYTLAHVVCPKTEWGLHVVEQIDAALVADRPTAEYRQLIERWLPESKLAEFRHQYQSKLNIP